MKLVMTYGHIPRKLYLHEALLLIIDSRAPRRTAEEEFKILEALEKAGIVKRGTEQT